MLVYEWVNVFVLQWVRIMLGYREELALTKALRRTPAPDRLRLPPAPKRPLYEITRTFHVWGRRVFTLKHRYPSLRAAEQAGARLDRKGRKWVMRHL